MILYIDRMVDKAVHHRFLWHMRKGKETSFCLCYMKNLRQRRYKLKDQTKGLFFSSITHPAAVITKDLSCR